MNKSPKCSIQLIRFNNYSKYILRMLLADIPSLSGQLQQRCSGSGATALVLLENAVRNSETLYPAIVPAAVPVLCGPSATAR